MANALRPHPCPPVDGATLSGPALLEAEALHDTVERLLDTHGHRYTALRRAIVEILGGAGRPVSVPDLMSGRRLSQSSLYRNLAALEEAMAVRRVITLGGQTHFELAEDLLEHHHHLICLRCGLISDLAAPPGAPCWVEEAAGGLDLPPGFELTGHRLDLYGDCGQCRPPSAPLGSPTEAGLADGDPA